MSRKISILVGILLVLTISSAAYVSLGTQAYKDFLQKAQAEQLYCGDQDTVHICVHTPAAIYSAFYPSYEAKHTPLFTIDYSSTATRSLSISVSLTGVTRVETHQVTASSIQQQILFVPPVPGTTLSGMTQELNTSLHVQVSDSNKHSYYENDIPILVHSRWLMDWTRTNRLQIAAWVTPDDRNIKDLVARATNILKQQASPALNSMIGYNGSTAQQVKAQVNAIYDALRTENIRYLNATVPYTGGDSEATSPQKIQLPFEVLKQRSGMCVELTVLLAAAVENIGLHPEIVITPGHAFLGVATNADETRFEYWDAVDVNNGVAADSANVAADALYTQNFKKHTLVDTILISAARAAGIGPML